MVLWWGRSISVPEKDQRSEIRLGRKLDGWRKENWKSRGLAMYEWVVEQQLPETWSEQRSPAGRHQVCKLNEWGELEQSLELYLAAFLKILVCIPFGDFLPEQRTSYFK